MTSEEETQRYKTLLDTARCFGRAMDLRTLIDEILDRSREVMRAGACTLLLPDPKTDDLILHSTDPRIAALKKPLRVPAGQGIAGAVFKSKQSLNIPDAQQDPRHYQVIGKQTGFLTRAIISVPLLDGAHCLGVLQAINPLNGASFEAQDQDIFEGFGALIVNALLRLDAQKREIERAEAQQEMLLAREIQDSFLPGGLPTFSFCHVHLNYFPAQVVGGDFYFVHPIGEQRLLVGLGDVTGRGVPAALTMARATAMIKAMISQAGDDLGEWVMALNRELVQDLKGGRFIGLTFLLADAASARLQLCAAGQFAPFHFHGQRWEHIALPHHLPLGISAAVNYRAIEAPLDPGDFWMLFSDGISEARNPGGEELTVPALLEKLPIGRTAGETMSAATEAWKNFVGSAAPHDDASLVLLDWRGLPPPASLELTCCLENLCRGREFVEKWARYAGYDDPSTGQIVMACDEAVSNVFRHGYERRPGPLTFQAELTNRSLVVRIIDEAGSMDAPTINTPELPPLRPGGLGTFIMSQVFDEVKYEPSGNGTALTLRKQLP